LAQGRFIATGARAVKFKRIQLEDFDREEFDKHDTSSWPGFNVPAAIGPYQVCDFAEPFHGNVSGGSD
jgi:hypothetical protein